MTKMCKECNNDYEDEWSDSRDEGFCSKWCAKKYADREYQNANERG